MTAAAVYHAAMFSEEDLVSAVNAGVLSDETAAAFREHVAQIGRTSVADEERFRLVTGFNDIFVVIACVLLLVSLGWIGSAVAAPAVGAVAAAAAAWGLSEFFVRRRRMALPAIVLLLAFVGAVFVAAITSLEPLPSRPLRAVVALAFTAAAAWMHWRRFQVPITVAAGCAAAIGFVIEIVIWAVPDALQHLSAFTFVAGVALFVLAMWWDAADPQRQTRRADIAFWLHLLAAPLLVHSVFTSIGVLRGETRPGQAVAVLALYVAIALVSLAIDRRALMVSALGYVLYTFSALLKQTGVVSLNFAVTALVIGSALLLLSAFWHGSRAVVLSRAGSRLQGWLPPAH
jgi:hypothetical protein